MKRRQYLGSMATIGAVSTLGAVPASAATVGTISDPSGDDYGPGTYTYPKTDKLPKGCFDVTKVDVEDTGDHWKLTYSLEKVPNSFGSKAGFSVQVFQLYIQDPNAPKDAPTSVSGRKGVVSKFQIPYHYRVHVTGYKQVVETPGTENSEPKVVAKDFPASGSSSKGTVTISIPKKPFETSDFKKLKVSMPVFSQDGFGKGGIRQGFSQSNADWTFGGVKKGASSTAPRIVDLVAPEAVVKQKEALSYSADSVARLPLTKAEYLLSGNPPATGIPTAIAAPGPTVWAGLKGQLDASSSKDPKDQSLTYSWTQISGPSVTLSGADTAKPTFTAPKVDSKTTLKFKVTVTDPDGNTATDTTTATIKPQSANDAPIAKAGEDITVKPGDAVLIQAAGSKDPNGGTLSFQWKQTAGPSVDLANADSFGASFNAPQVDKKTTLTFELTVSDGQGKSTTDTVNVTVKPASTGMTTTADTGATTTTSTGTGGTTTKGGGDTGGGSGPGFGAITGLVSVAGGAALAGKRLLTGEDDE